MKDPTLDSNLVLILLEKETCYRTTATQRVQNSSKWKFSCGEGVWKVAELRPSLPKEQIKWADWWNVRTICSSCSSQHLSEFSSRTLSKKFMQIKLCRKQIPDKSSAHYTYKKPLHLWLQAQRAAALVQLQQVCRAACPKALKNCCILKIFPHRCIYWCFPSNRQKQKLQYYKINIISGISDQQLVQINLSLKF